MSLHRGGTNWLSYRLDEPNHGYIAEYHLAQTPIAFHFQEAFDNGQRAAGFPIPIWHGGFNGLTLDSTGGCLSGQSDSNFRAILNKLKSIGYEQVKLEPVFLGPNDALRNWPEFDTPVNAQYPQWADLKGQMYAENTLFVQYLRNVVKDIGFQAYYIDVVPEGIPLNNQPVWAEFSKRAWIDYTIRNGDPANGNKVSDATISMVPHPEAVANLEATFSGNPPAFLDIHIYEGTASQFWGSAYTTFTTIFHLLDTALELPWMIGETFANGVTARELARAAKDTGQVIDTVYQWQLSGNNTNQGQLDIIPTMYQAFLDAGL